MLCLRSLESKKGEEGTEQSDVEVTVLKKKGKEPLYEPVSEAELMNFLNSLSTASTTLLSSYINYQLRFPCCHWCWIPSLTESHAKSVETSLRAIQCFNWQDRSLSGKYNDGCHNGFPSRLGWPQTNQWSRHQSFLYGCDRSPKVHVLKLGIEIPNLKQYDWSTKLIWEF